MLKLKKIAIALRWFIFLFLIKVLLSLKILFPFSIPLMPNKGMGLKSYIPIPYPPLPIPTHFPIPNPGSIQTPPESEGMSARPSSSNLCNDKYGWTMEALGEFRRWWEAGDSGRSRRAHIGPAQRWIPNGLRPGLINIRLKILLALNHQI